MLVSFFRRSKSSLSNIASSWLLGKGESSWSAVCTLRMDVVELHGVCIVILGSWKEWTLKNLWQRCLALKCYPVLQIPVFLPFNHLFLHPEALTGSQHWAANSYSFLEPLHLPCKLGGFFFRISKFLQRLQREWVRKEESRTSCFHLFHTLDQKYFNHSTSQNW